MKVWMNGHLVDDADAKVSVLDVGFLYGDGLFETLRVDGGLPIQWQEHLARFIWSAYQLEIDLRGQKEVLKAALLQTIEANNLKECALRLTVTRGMSAGWIPGEAEGPPTLVVTARTPIAPPVEWRAITVPSPFRLGAELPRHKTLNYLPNLLAQRAAVAAGADEALLVCEGRVLEGAMSNFFAVVDGALRTAPVADGVLPGIVRASVLDLARAGAVRVEERAVLEDELPRASECFCTNSLIGVQPVTRIGGGKVGSGEIGELTRGLRLGYERIAQSG